MCVCGGVCVGVCVCVCVCVIWLINDIKVIHYSVLSQSVKWWIRQAWWRRCIARRSQTRGEHSHWKVVRGCDAVMPLLFPYLSSLPRLPIYLSCAHHFPFFKENLCIFSLVLAKIWAFKTEIFKIFVPKTPHFSRKIRSLDPTFGNPCGTHPTKKLSAPHPGSRRINTHYT